MNDGFFDGGDGMNNRRDDYGASPDNGGAGAGTGPDDSNQRSDNGYSPYSQPLSDNSQSGEEQQHCANPNYSGQNYGYTPNGGYNNEQQYEQPHEQPPASQYTYPAGNNGGKPVKKGNTGTKVFIILIVAIVVLAIALMVSIFTRNSDGGGKQNDSVISEDESDENKLDTGNVGELTRSASSLGAGEAAEVALIAKKYNVGILIYKSDTLYTEGSGVVVKEDDEGKYTYIVTCAHVVNQTDTAVSVLMEDNTEYPAEVVGLDTRTDLAVVRIEESGLDTAEFADSDELIVGQTVYAVGNPGGSEFFGSLTNGIISAIDRPVSSSTGYEMECIQHTAAINPGNSGGALVNGEGKVIGINSMKIASTEYEGMGFSVPSNVVIDVFNSIIENGYVAGRAKLGITYTTPSGYSQTYAMYVQMRGLPSGTIVIAGISDDSDLADEDVKVGDLITKVNGKDMTDSGMLSAMIEDMSVGDTLTLTIVRLNTDNWSQTEQNITVTLVEDKGNSTVQSNEDDNSSQNNPFGGNGSDDYQDWYDYFKQYYGY